VRPTAWRAAGAGYTHNERWVVELEDGRSAFVKAAVDEMTAEWLRAEQRVYAAITAEFLPRLLGWEDGELPVLLLEDLSGAEWPPPWTRQRVGAVRATLREVAETPPPPGLPSLEEQREELAGWREVERDPAALLALGVCSREWLDEALPALLAAEDACVLEGEALLHLDVRSDNICFREGRALLVDWSWAVRGNPVFDLAAWLPSLEAEGGSPPEALLPEAPEAAAFMSGFFAARAGLPRIPTAPHVREIQLAQLRTALPWAARALGLAEPRGSR
jgi:aminoglycoside phosphotransferase (APT) family kinase protein